MMWLSELGIINFNTYVLGVIAIILLPGPNSLFVLTTAAKKGIARGYAAACGVFVGDSVLMAAAVLGGAVLLQKLPYLYTALKICGAVYLVYLGFQILKSARDVFKQHCTLQHTQTSMHGAAADFSEKTYHTQEGLEEKEVNSPMRPVTIDKESAFINALLISLINPKAILFFLSFFLQFVDKQAHHPYAAFTVLGLVGQFFSFIYLSALIFMGSELTHMFKKRPQLIITGNTLVGLLFIGFGAKLALS